MRYNPTHASSQEWREIHDAAGLHRDQGRHQAFGGTCCRAAAVGGDQPVIARKPAWLRARLGSGAGFTAVKQIVRDHRLSTVCEEAKCPNIGECWNAGTATIMLMGAVCTRACRFCAVDTGNPRGWLDPEEPENVARSVDLMGSSMSCSPRSIATTLPDGGAAHYAAAVRAIKRRRPETAVEALTPDFQGVLEDVRRCSIRRCRGVRAKRGDGRATDASGARSARRLRANLERAAARESLSARGADQDQPDAGSGRNRCGDHARPWPICAARRSIS
jgi:hypothetical protein